MTTDPLREGLVRLLGPVKDEWRWDGVITRERLRQLLAETEPAVAEIRLTKAVCTDPACTIKTKPGRPKHGPHDFRAATPPPAPVAGAEDTEMYTVYQIRKAFDQHAHPDDWNVPSFYEDSLIAALRGEYDKPTPEES